MRILVTLGTTQFDGLIRYSDMNLNEHSVTIQTTSNIQLTNAKLVYYANEFLSFCSKFEVIITHAGAGNVYTLLESGFKLIVVPNLERSDKHQSDLANFIEENNFAIVCHNLSDLNQCIEKISTHSFEPYKKDSFDFVQFNEILGLDDAP
jgi:beta-1,4-N-acetylglucosaminyltransferase